MIRAGVLIPDRIRGRAVARTRAAAGRRARDPAAGPWRKGARIPERQWTALALGLSTVCLAVAAALVLGVEATDTAVTAVAALAVAGALFLGCAVTCGWVAWRVRGRLRRDDRSET